MKEIIKKYTDGVAVHWYWDQLVKSNVLDDFHQKYPNQTIISSEACLGDFTPGPEVAFESVWYYAAMGSRIILLFSFVQCILR